MNWSMICHVNVKGRKEYLLKAGKKARRPGYDAVDGVFVELCRLVPPEIARVVLSYAGMRAPFTSISEYRGSEFSELVSDELRPTRELIHIDGYKRFRSPFESGFLVNALPMCDTPGFVFYHLDDNLGGLHGKVGRLAMAFARLHHYDMVAVCLGPVGGCVRYGATTINPARLGFVAEMFRGIVVPMGVGWRPVVEGVEPDFAYAPRFAASGHDLLDAAGSVPARSKFCYLEGEGMVDLDHGIGLYSAAHYAVYGTINHVPYRPEIPHEIGDHQHSVTKTVKEAWSYDETSLQEATSLAMQLLFPNRESWLAHPYRMTVWEVVRQRVNEWMNLPVTVPVHILDEQGYDMLLIPDHARSERDIAAHYAWASYNL